MAPVFVAIFHARRLPHYYSEGSTVFLTWRLHGSLPDNRRFPDSVDAGRAFFAMDRLLDSGCTGPLYLARPEIAKMVAESLQFRERGVGQYQLHAWVVMSNHVHVLVTPKAPVSKVMQSLKRFTAREGNRILGLTGQAFWQDESFDRVVRDGGEFARIARYIEMNPVRAGLVERPEEFAWSSARPMVSGLPAGACFASIANRPQDAILPHKKNDASSF